MREQYTLAICEVFHVRPWEIALLTHEQFHAMRDRIDQMTGGG